MGQAESRTSLAGCGSPHPLMGRPNSLASAAGDRLSGSEFYGPLRASGKRPARNWRASARQLQAWIALPWAWRRARACYAPSRRSVKPG
jgi:hypothetical protein